MALELAGEPGLIIHTRPYKENSLLVELYTLNFGRVSACVRLSKKQGSRSIGIFQPYMPLKLVLSQSKSSLWTLKDAFMQSTAYKIQVPQLFSAIYINELLYHLVKTHDSDPKLFACYLSCLEKLQDPNQEFMALREFESVLIEALGYGVRYELFDGSPLKEQEYYFFNPQNGFEIDHEVDNYSYKGSDLIRLSRGDVDEPKLKKILKNINKSIIDSLLEGRALKSRELYAQYLTV